MHPKTEYVRSGDLHIAYQVMGQGPLDIVYVPGWVSHCELAWELPDLVLGFERLASFARLILFDKRGTGMSDRVPNDKLPALDERMDDVRAVMDAAGSERAAFFGASEGGNMSILFAATHPERTVALCTFGCFSKRVWSPDYPWAPTPAERQATFDTIANDWEAAFNDIAPSLDPLRKEQLVAYHRRCASPGAALALLEMNTPIDVRDVLPSIRVPTLVMHRSRDQDVKIEESRYLAEHIPGARFVEIPGVDHTWWTEGRDAILDEIEEHLTGIKPAPEPDRVLATVLFTDIVGATKGVVERGDRRWLDLLQQHHALVPQRAGSFPRARSEYGRRFVHRHFRWSGARGALRVPDSRRDQAARDGNSGRGAHRGKSSGSDTISAASRSTSERGWRQRPSPVRFSSPARCAT